MKSATTVIKVCRIIDELSRWESLGISEISRRTALLPSDVHRIVNSLRTSGYVDQDRQTRKYYLGTHVLRVGLEACQQNPLYEKAHPELVRLAGQIQATVHLGAFDAREMQVFLIDDVNGTGRGRSRGRLGGTEPLHCSALGKAIAASLDGPTIESALDKSGMARGTSRTITNRGDLAKEFEKVRGQGYAVDREECFEGLCCLGCEVRDCSGEIVGSISTSMATPQFLLRNEALLALDLKAAANKIAGALDRSTRPSSEIHWLGRDWRSRIRTREAQRDDSPPAAREVNGFQGMGRRHG
jgi:IclR family KDG regulon transcriptional repressor